MPVIVHIPDGTVLTYNPVFHIIQVILAFLNLLADTFSDFLQILRMNHPLKSISCQFPKFLLRIAAKHPGRICINQLLFLVRMVNKKPSRHLVNKLLYLARRLPPLPLQSFLQGKRFFLPLQTVLCLLRFQRRQQIFYNTIIESHSTVHKNPLTKRSSKYFNISSSPAQQKKLFWMKLLRRNKPQN